jgi:DNA-binding response OmpR family regulator
MRFSILFEISLKHTLEDLAVLDIMMPKMDGYELTRLLRESNNNLPILMVSAKQLPADKHKGFSVGTDDYITKPIDDEEMLYRIKALLRRAKIASERRIVIGEVVRGLGYKAVKKQ